VIDVVTVHAAVLLEELIGAHRDLFVSDVRLNGWRRFRTGPCDQPWPCCSIGL
jgi:hypothetical protein